MMQSKVILNFKTFSFRNLEHKANVVLASLSNNPHFPEPVPALSEFSETIKAYSLAIMAAETGNRAEIAFKKQKRKALEQILRRLVSYVNFMAKGDRNILLTSGFDINKEQEQNCTIEKPSDLKVINGLNAGELIVSVPAVRGAVAYLYQYTNDAIPKERSWKNSVSSCYKYKICNLESGKRYWCRVTAIGTRGQVEFSNLEQCIVQ